MATYTTSVVTATTAAGSFPNQMLFSAPVLSTGHLGRVFRARDDAANTYRYALVTEVLSATQAQVIWLAGASLPVGVATAVWEEEAFSTVRGWPRSVALHQQRLVFGGSRDAGDALWLSRAGQFFNFDLGTGLATHAIAVNVAGTDIRTITHVVSSRYLTIFTEAAVYFVSETNTAPLTPASFPIRRIAPFGAANVRPGELDGGLLMVQSPTSVVRDIAYDEESVNVQAVPISSPVETVLGDVVETAFLTAAEQGPQQYGFFVNDAGSIWVLHSARTQRIAAWTEWTTKGSFLSVCVTGGRVFVAVKRDTAYYLEQFDDATPFDCTVPLTYDDAQALPIPVTHLPAAWIVHGTAQVAGQPFDYLGRGAITGGRVALTRQVGEVRDYGTGTRLLGLSFDWWIDPLQPVIDMPDGTSLTRVQRLTKTSLYLRGAYAAQVGERVLTLTASNMDLATVPAPRDNWWSVRHLGWSRENDARLTPRITRDTPLPVGVLSMVREVIV